MELTQRTGKFIMAVTIGGESKPLSQSRRRVG